VSNKARKKRLLVEVAETQREQAKLEEKMNKLLFKYERLAGAEKALAIMTGLQKAIPALTEEEFMICSPLIRKYMIEVQSLAGPEFLEANPDFVKLSKLIGQAADLFNQAEQDYKRQVRLAKRSPVPDVVQEGRKCSRCNKRPAKFDDLCGRCAEETGVRAHGKV